MIIFKELLKAKKFKNLTQSHHLAMAKNPNLKTSDFIKFKANKGFGQIFYFLKPKKCLFTYKKFLSKY